MERTKSPTMITLVNAQRSTAPSAKPCVTLLPAVLTKGVPSVIRKVTLITCVNYISKRSLPKHLHQRIPRQGVPGQDHHALILITSKALQGLSILEYRLSSPSRVMVRKNLIHHRSSKRSILSSTPSSLQRWTRRPRHHLLRQR